MEVLMNMQLSNLQPPKGINLVNCTFDELLSMPPLVEEKPPQQQVMSLIPTTTTTRDIIKEELAKDWLDFADVRPSSVKAYNKGIKTFFKFCRENRITQPKRKDVIAFRTEELMRFKPSTVRSHVLAVRLFFKWLASKELYPNIADNVKSPKVSYSHKKLSLTKEALHDMLVSIDTSTIVGKRNKAIFALLASCGLRRIEVIRLDIGDIYQNGDKYMMKIWGKGRDGKDDDILLPNMTKELIDEYLAEREKKTGKKLSKSQPVFAPTGGKRSRFYGDRLREDSVSQLIKNIFRANGRDDPMLTCHSLRHSFATIALKEGIDIEKVRMCLRHHSIQTTEIYRHDIERNLNDTENVVADAIFNVNNDE